VLNNPNLFEPLNQYFDKIYVLTLERAIDRQEEIKLSLQGLNYNFFFGVDKKELDIATLEADDDGANCLLIQPRKNLRRHY
jgi:hypothetical protein